MKKVFAFFMAILTAYILSGCGEPVNSTVANSSTSISSSENSSTPDTVVVPNVVGMQKDEAVKLLEGMGLKVELEKKYATRTQSSKFEYETNNKVLEQDIKSGILTTKNTQIVLKYNLNQSGFMYKSNSDGDNTITLDSITFSCLDLEKHTLYIPKKYEGKIVTRVNSSIIDTVSYEYEFYFPDVTTSIPYDVKVVGTPYDKYCRY